MADIYDFLPKVKSCLDIKSNLINKKVENLAKALFKMTARLAKTPE